MARFRIALIAHDQMKNQMVEWAERHRLQLAQCDIVATGTTGGRILERCPELSISRMKSGPMGGDQQIGALIAEEQIHGLVFFIDPLSPHPHDVDVKALTRLAIVYNIPMACNPATAELMVAGAASSPVPKCLT